MFRSYLIRHLICQQQIFAGSTLNLTQLLPTLFLFRPIFLLPLFSITLFIHLRHYPYSVAIRRNQRSRRNINFVIQTQLPHSTLYVKKVSLHHLLIHLQTVQLLIIVYPLTTTSFKVDIFVQHTLNPLKSQLTQPNDINLIILLLLIKPQPKTIYP